MGGDAELVALRVGHRHVGVGPVELDRTALDEPGDLSLQVIAAQVHVQPILATLRSGSCMNR